MLISTAPLFDPSHCPPQSSVGRMEIKSPVLPTSTCDAESESFCQSQIAVSFGNAPDLPVTSVKFDLSGPTRTGIGGAQLAGDMVVLAEPGDSTSVSSASVVTTIAPNSGTPAVVRSVQQLVAGC